MRPEYQYIFLDVVDILELGHTATPHGDLVETGAFLKH